MAKPVFKKDDKVFAKVKGYPPWPATIVADTGKKRYNVLFYGTKETGTIKAEDICYYNKNKHNYVHKYLKRGGYEDAVKEIEAAIKEKGGDGNDEVILSKENTAVESNEKKAPKRKATSLPDEPVAKRPMGRRKSIASHSHGNEDTVEVPFKKPRLKPIEKDENDIKSIEQLEKENESPKKKESPSKPKTDLPVQPEETVEKEFLIDYELVTEKLLKNNILYADHVRNQKNLYKDMAVEPRNDNEHDIFAVKLPSGAICGLKVHRKWPLQFSNELDRALHDEEVAKELLDLKDRLQSGKTTVESDKDAIISDINMTEGKVNEICNSKDIQSKRDRLEKLKAEAHLMGLIAKIKNCLGLENADPSAALEHLKEFDKLEIDIIVLKKHPHVLDTIRRLRKYIGNVKDWNLTDVELDEFSKNASKIRTEAHKVYTKIKQLINIPQSSSSFWDAFLELIKEFQKQCKELGEDQICILCAEPYSRKAFFDKLDEVTETEKT